MADDDNRARLRVSDDATANQKAPGIDTLNFRDLFDGSTQGFLIHYEFRPIFANQALADIFGYGGPDAILAMGSVIDLFAPDEQGRFRGDIQSNPSRQSTPAIHEYQGVMLDGSPIWLESSVSVFEWNGGSAFLSCFMNIEERKNTEQLLHEHEAELRMHRDQAEQANQAKSKFMANVSHELRTPLNAVIGFSDIMRQPVAGDPGGDRFRDYAGNIFDSANHLLKLISNILDISTIDSGEYLFLNEKFPFSELIAECFEDLNSLTNGRGLTLEIDLPDSLPSLNADRDSIFKVLQNLLSNAIRFTPDDGTVSVSAIADEDWFTFIVVDTGMGIPEADIPKLTEPFERGRRDPYMSEDGSGLGLAVALSLVELYGGTLDIASDVGAGTTVTVRLPV